MNYSSAIWKVAGIVLVASAAYAADHLDSPAATDDPAADITDLYAWMSSDASMVNLVLNVTPFATSGSSWSTAVQYVFHVNSSTAYGSSQTETLVICEFSAATEITCWVGDEKVSGNPTSTTGLTNDDDTIRIFAGPRDDPFFMEFTGFTETVEDVVAAAPGLTFDGDGCPAIDTPTSNALVAQLQSGAMGAAASDTFAGSNVLSLVIQLDKTLVTPGGPLIGVWASTNQRN